MDEDKLTFLDHDEAPEPEPERAEASPEPAPEPEPEPEAETGEKEAAPPAAEDRNDVRNVPLTALLDEREKRKELERRLQEFEAERKKAETPKPPDWFDDPERRIAHERQAVEERLWNERLNMSELLIRDRYGDEKVDAAAEAFQAAAKENPALVAEFQRHRNPYDYVVKWHERETFLREVQDPETWKQQERERIRQEMLAEMQRGPVPSNDQPKPPRSLASAPAASASQPSQGSAFDAIFPD